MNVVVTHHAAQRFAKRHASHLTAVEAEDFLRQAWPRAGRIRERTYSGQEQWQLDEPRCVLVVKRDADGTVAIVTVLPRWDAIGLSEEGNDWLEALAEASPAVAREVAEVRAAVESPGALTPSPVQAASIASALRLLRQTLMQEAIPVAAEAKRARAQAEHVEAERQRMKRALRAALRGLTGRTTVEVAVAGVAAVDPGLLGAAFLDREEA